LWRGQERAVPLEFPTGWEQQVQDSMAFMERKGTVSHGEDGPIDEDDLYERGPEARLLWPFSIEVSKGHPGPSS